MRHLSTAGNRDKFADQSLPWTTSLNRGAPDVSNLDLDTLHLIQPIAMTQQFITSPILDSPTRKRLHPLDSLDEPQPLQLPGGWPHGQDGKPETLPMKQAANDCLLNIYDAG